MCNGKFIRNVVQRGSSQCDSVLRAKHVFPYRSISSTDKEIYDDGAKRLLCQNMARRSKVFKERPWRWSQRVGPDHQGRISTRYECRNWFWKTDHDFKMHLLNLGCPSEPYTTTSVTNWNTAKGRHAWYQHVWGDSKKICASKFLFHILDNLKKMQTGHGTHSYRRWDTGAAFHSSYRGADKSLARPGREQANVSVRMAWISLGVLPCR